jgi:hypothetical protein
MSFLKRITVALLFVLVLPATAMAQDSSDTDQLAPHDVQTVSMLLSGYHDLASQETLSQVPNARSIVETLAQGPNGFVRNRALAAMGRYWPSGDVYLLLANVLTADDTPEGTRHRVLLLFADAFGDRAIPVIRPFLAANDLQLQITAVQAFGMIGTDEAVAIVHDFAAGATHPVLIEQVEKSTRVLR